MTVRITPAAEADLFDIALTIALDDPRASDRFITTIDKDFAAFPSAST
jgi:plasmid stabilization system protein ParE